MGLDDNDTSITLNISKEIYQNSEIKDFSIEFTY